MSGPSSHSPLPRSVARLGITAMAFVVALAGCTHAQTSESTQSREAGADGGAAPSSYTVITEANACQLQELVRFERDPVLAVKYSPLGDFIAVAKSREILILDSAELTQRSTWPLATPAEQIAISPDARMLAVLTADAVQQWDIATATLRSQAVEDEANFLDLGYTADGEYLVATSWEGVHVWSAGEAALVRRLEDPAGLHQVAFTADGQRLVLPGTWGSTCLQEWDIATETEGGFACWAEAGEWEEPPLVAVSSVEDLFAVAPEAGAVFLLEGDEAGSLGLRATLGEELQWVDRVEFSPDGRYLAAVGRTAGAGREIHVWEVAQASQVLRLEGERFAFAPDSQGLLAGYAGSIRLHRLPSGEEATALEERMMAAFTLAPDGDRLALTMSDGTLEVRGKRGQELIATLADPEISQNLIWFSPDGEWLLAGNRGSGWSIWHVRTGTRAWTIPSAESALLLGDLEAVLVLTSDRSTLELRRLDDGTVLQRLVHPAEVRGFVLSGQGGLLATNVADETVWLWKLPEAKFERSLEDYHVALAFNPEGTQLVTQGDGGMLKVWSVTDGRLVAEHDFGSGDLWVEWTRGSGQLLVWLEEADEIYLWQPGQAEPLKLESEFSPTLSGNGVTLVTRAWGGLVRIRDLRTSEAREAGDWEARAPVAISPNGEVLLTSEWNGPIQLWATSSLQPACTLLEDYRDFQYGYFDSLGVRLVIYNEFTGLSVWGIP